MVAGCRFWGGNEEKRAQHQTSESSDLAVKTVPQDGNRTGEPRGLPAGIEPSREVDEEYERQAEKPEWEDEPAKAPPPAPPCRREGRRKECERNQNIGMRLARRLDFHGGRCGRGKAGVARLTYLDRVVVDELRDHQAAGGDNDHQTGRTLRRQDGACPRRQGDGAPDASFASRKAAKHQSQNRPECSAAGAQQQPGKCNERLRPRPEPCAGPLCPGAEAPGDPRDARMGTDEHPVAPSIEALGPPLQGGRSRLQQHSVGPSIDALTPSSWRGGGSGHEGAIGPPVHLLGQSSAEVGSRAEPTPDRCYHPRALRLPS
jgi:hypothetical protein